MRRALSAVLVISIAFAAALTMSTDSDAAARYVLEKCDSALPGGGTAGAVFSGPAPYTPGNNCAEAGGALVILQGGPTSESESHWSLPIPAPPGGTLESVTVTAEICDGSNHDPGTVAYAIAPSWAPSCATQVRSFPVNSALGSSGLLSLGCSGGCAEDPFVWAHYFAGIEVDPVPPRIAALRGSLVAGGTVHGAQTLTAAAQDEGGGVASVALRINGSLLAPARTFSCQTVQTNNSSVFGSVAIVPTPCPSTAETSWPLNTESFPFRNGENTIQVCADDFSTIGAANEGCTEQSVKVDNSCPQSLVGGGEELRAVFKHSERQRISVGFGHAAKIAGRLTNASHQPVPGATVCVWARTYDSHRSKELLQALVTDAHGHYSYLLSPGPNRAVVVGYRQDARQLERHLRYLAHAHPTLHSSPRQLSNGRWVHFNGKLPGPRRHGRVVILQAGVVGSSRWITFRKAITDRKGSFHASYHFDSTTRRTVYRFRAVVPMQAGYPWIHGHSRPVRVVVTG